MLAVVACSSSTTAARSLTNVQELENLKVKHAIEPISGEAKHRLTVQTSKFEMCSKLWIFKIERYYQCPFQFMT